MRLIRCDRFYYRSLTEECSLSKTILRELTNIDNINNIMTFFFFLCPGFPKPDSNSLTSVSVLLLFVRDVYFNLRY